MLDFHNILWVIPGVIFIYFYNRFRPVTAEQQLLIFQAGHILFFLVVIAAFTWLPAELIMEICNNNTDLTKKLMSLIIAISFILILLLSLSKITMIKLICIVFIGIVIWLSAELMMETCNKALTKQLMTLIIAISFTSILLLFAQIESIAKLIFLPVQDNFYKKCVEWENKEILLTLKNGKTYQGLLWKYPDSPKSRHESQTISMVPFKSGYRNNETKEVMEHFYPKYKEYYDLVDMEIIIPRTEIITFGKFSNKTFEHFEDQKSQKE